MPVNRRGASGLVLALAFLVAVLAGCGGGDAGRAEVGAGATATAAPRATSLRPTATTATTATQRAELAGQGARSTQAPQRASDGLPTIAFAQLPREAQETIRLIDRGGPFPYKQDGTTFGNRERLLPAQPQGYYREYTVITPGESDRGARRIVAGRGGELYYTDDHYESFKRVVR